VKPQAGRREGDMKPHPDDNTKGDFKKYGRVVFLPK